ncbi:hypothetical protein F4V43_04375 [Paenibacillus spiritus]|uniref:Uncharacterized protein n=1 Tax=Paenibacillus spiritus TaxID=2496557 RepID=A0A5J5GI62_9BACL|nr:hypothetical protein [Paenibacillus spiritus]KAA9007720.1 hypothetical protein F4V43_04375 [Paenibacillus spiritus]
MSKHIQAYFRSEDEAEGAKTALLGYRTDSLEMSPLTEPLGQGRTLLVPIIPYNSASIGGTGIGSSYNAPVGPIVAAAATAPDDQVDGRDTVDKDHVIAPGREYTDADLSELHYVMSFRIGDADEADIVSALRSKNAFVEVLD